MKRRLTIALTILSLLLGLALWSAGRGAQATASLAAPAAMAGTTSLMIDPAVDNAGAVAELIAALNAAARPVFANQVVTNLNDSGAGSLRQAIADVGSGETISFQAGLTGTITLTTGELSINKSLTIQGPGANLLTVSGNNDVRVFNIAAGNFNVTFSGLTIASGDAGFSGGGIYNNSTGTLTVTNSTLSNNDAGDFGGGIYNSNGTLTVTNSTLSNNFAEKRGGGIYNNVNGTLTVTNSTLSGNDADLRGGGIYNDEDATLTVTNSTLSGNDADDFGGGIYNDAGTANVRNTIIAGNTADESGPDVCGTFSSQGYNLIGKNNDSTGFPAGNPNLNNDLVGTSGAPLDPMLDPNGLQNNGGPTLTIKLLPSSPAINAGDNCVVQNPGCLAAPLTTDQRGPGFPRNVGSMVDIGAFEFGDCPPTVVTTNSNSGAGSLRQAIADVCDGGTITFAGSVASPITLMSELTINKSLTIQGPGANLLTVSGNQMVRVFNIAAGNFNVTLSGLTLANGHTGGFGGGIRNDSTGTVNVTSSMLSSNSATSGGGIYKTGTGTMNVTNSTLSGNSASEGGGINTRGTVNVTNSTLSGNSASVEGGGIILHDGGTLTITNSTIAGNFAGSSSFTAGGGGVSTLGTVNVKNTIIAGNTTNSGGPDVGGNFNSQGYNLIGKGNGSTGFMNGSNNDQVGSSAAPLDPLLGPLAYNGGPTQTHALLVCSPAIDKGSAANDPATSNPITTDQRGYMRPVDNPAIPPATGGDDSDIGAFETQAPLVCNTPPTITGATLSRQQGAAGTVSTIATVSDAEDAETTLTLTATLATGSGVTLSDISVDSSGNVTATVAASCAATDASFTLEVTDSGNLMDSATLNVNVTAETTPPDTNITSVPPAISAANVSFSFTGTDNCAVSSFECKLNSGAWTACTSPQAYNGLSNGAHTFQVRAKDATGNVDPTPATYPWNVFVASCGTTVNPTSFVQASLGIPFAQALSASPTGSYSFSLFAGTLPPGLQIVNTAGYYSLSGTPTIPGTYTFTLRARKNNSTCEGIRTYTMTIAPTVVPKVNCKTLNANGSYTVWFGYDNSTGAAVTIPVGPDNYFTSGAADRGQTTVFQPGTVMNAFSVTFASAGAFTSWSLKGPDGVLRGVVPSVLSPNCP